MTPNKKENLKEAKYLRNLISERLNLNLNITTGAKYKNGKIQEVAVLEDDNGIRYTTEEIQTVLQFLLNFKEYRKKVLE